ncbi:MAG: hypothetical protein F4Y26_00515 [Gammaproteobacteria bacterium]|nr:hypothetical protein [Gammaproteobacteria bacterium]
MAKPFDIQIEGLEELEDKLAPEDFERALGKGLDAWALLLQERLAVYPRASKEKQPFKTDKQRRGFFAKLNAGQIRVPYRRSGILKNSWTPKSPTPASRVVATAIPYAPYVMGELQSEYHKGTWPFYGTVAEKTKTKGLAAIEHQVRLALAN